VKVGGPFADPKGQTWGLAYVHPMSKRTNLYASYGQTRNNETGAFNLRYSQSGVNAGALDADPRAFAVGIRHMF
jgi:predicted porin